MSEKDIPSVPPAVDNAKTGYKHPPARNRFPKGKSGNPFGRRKGQRNLSTVLIEILGQTVTVKQGDKSERMTKGDAALKVIMSKANNGDRRAIDAVLYLAEKIGRVDDMNSETSQRGGVMLIPGVASSTEEWQKAVAEGKKRREASDLKAKGKAAVLEAWERDLRNRIHLHKGTPQADEAAATLAEITQSEEYRTNFYVRRNLAFSPDEHATAGSTTKKQPVAKLPWDPDEYVRMPFSQRAEYARTHAHKEELEAQRQKAELEAQRQKTEPRAQRKLAPYPVYCRIGNREMWSAVPWSKLPPGHPGIHPSYEEDE